VTCDAWAEEEKAVAEVGCWAVEGFTGEVTHRGDGGAECPADLSLKGVELGVAEETEQEGEVLTDEQSSNDVNSAGFCEQGGG
jgi:hypothetical protein